MAMTQKADESQLRSRNNGLRVSGFLYLGGNICNFRGLPFTSWIWSSSNKIHADSSSLPARGRQRKGPSGPVLPLLAPCPGCTVGARPEAAQGSLFTFGPHCPARLWPQEEQNTILRERNVNLWMRRAEERAVDSGPTIGTPSNFSEREKNQGGLHLGGVFLGRD